MEDIHALAEKIFLAYMANSSLAENISDNRLAAYSYSAAESFIEHKQKVINADIDKLQGKVTEHKP